MIDFGQVCLRSASSKDLMIVNNLDMFIHIVVQVCWLVLSILLSVLKHAGQVSYVSNQ